MIASAGIRHNTAQAKRFASMNRALGVARGWARCDRHGGVVSDAGVAVCCAGTAGMQSALHTATSTLFAPAPRAERAERKASGRPPSSVDGRGGDRARRQATSQDSATRDHHLMSSRPGGRQRPRALAPGRQGSALRPDGHSSGVAGIGPRGRTI
jgi:hypothetical protein